MSESDIRGDAAADAAGVGVVTVAELYRRLGVLLDTGCHPETPVVVVTGDEHGYYLRSVLHEDGGDDGVSVLDGDHDVTVLTRLQLDTTG